MDMVFPEGYKGGGGSKGGCCRGAEEGVGTIRRRIRSSVSKSSCSKTVTAFRNIRCTLPHNYHWIHWETAGGLHPRSRCCALSVAADCGTSSSSLPQRYQNFEKIYFRLSSDLFPPLVQRAKDRVIRFFPTLIEFARDSLYPPLSDELGRAVGPNLDRHDRGWGHPRILSIGGVGSSTRTPEGSQQPEKDGCLAPSGCAGSDHRMFGPHRRVPCHWSDGLRRRPGQAAAGPARPVTQHWQCREAAVISRVKSEASLLANQGQVANNSGTIGEVLDDRDRLELSQQREKN
eukprot:767656-Hanusia_phi.AAC.4